MQYKIDTSENGYIWVFKRQNIFDYWVKLKWFSSVKEAEAWLSELVRVQNKVYEVK